MIGIILYLNDGIFRNQCQLQQNRYVEILENNLHMTFTILIDIDLVVELRSLLNLSERVLN